MEIYLLSEILGDRQPALTGTLHSNLPHSTDVGTISDEATNFSSNPNHDRVGAVICKIEDIFESLADCVLDGKKEMIIELKTRKKRGNQGRDAVDGTITDLGEGKVTSVKFPSRSPQEAWKFGKSWKWKWKDSFLIMWTAALLRILELSHEALATGTVVMKRSFSFPSFRHIPFLDMFLIIVCFIFFMSY